MEDDDHRVFKERGKAASIEEVKCLLELIKTEKRSLFKAMTTQLAIKL